MSNRGLGLISIISGVIAVAVFIMVISAYANSGGGVVAGAPVAQATPGQPVDSEGIYGAGGGSQTSAAPAVTPQPVSTDQSQAQSGSQPQPVIAPSANAPANPFTSGMH
ncbi:MAG TPA: hypothetical protein VGG22_05130 [Candidatus Baltobacteraceae bacterium]|jgi:hypothetical protein